MAFIIPKGIGVSREFSPTAKPEEIEAILRVTELLPESFELILEEVKKGSSLEKIQGHLEIMLTDLTMISEQIALVLPHKQTLTH